MWTRKTLLTWLTNSGTLLVQDHTVSLTPAPGWGLSTAFTLQNQRLALPHFPLHWRGTRSLAEGALALRYHQYRARCDREALTPSFSSMVALPHHLVWWWWWWWWWQECELKWGSRLRPTKAMRYRVSCQSQHRTSWSEQSRRWGKRREAGNEAGNERGEQYWIDTNGTIWHNETIPSTPECMSTPVLPPSWLLYTQKGYRTLICIVKSMAGADIEEHHIIALFISIRFWMQLCLIPFSCNKTLR